MTIINRDSKILITGIANKKSVAYSVAKNLQAAGESLFFTAQFPEQLVWIQAQFDTPNVILCDLGQTASIAALKERLQHEGINLKGLLHSVAFGRFVPGRAFEATSWEDFSEALRISAFSLMELCHHLKELLLPGASVVTLSISNVRATSYGYMGPIKAMLNSMIDFLAYSFREQKVRFNAVGAGPLKTTASAGLPGFVDQYLYCEQLTLRQQNVATQEVANTCAFLLSALSNGINSTVVTVDAGMSANYFDPAVVKAFVQNSNT